MKTQVISESDMNFGPYNIDNLFYVEKSKLYINLKEGVKIAEFVLLKHEMSKSTLLIVEAKKSSPKFTGKNNMKFDNFINDIIEKFVNTLSLTFSCCLQRQEHALSELPESFQNLDLKSIDVQFVLVFKDYKKSWLPPLQDALRKKLNAFVKVWAFSRNLPVLVLNEPLAIRHQLINRNTI